QPARMCRPQKIDQAGIEKCTATHAGWTVAAPGALTKTFKFADFNGALGFVVRVGLAAERRDHHPDVELGWGRAKLTWSTHDAGGITQLDLDLAEASDSF